MRMADIRPGWTVEGNDDRPVGKVRHVGQNYLVASTAGLPTDFYIPASAIANVENEVVYLNVAQRDVAQMGWSAAPREDDTPATSPEADLHRHV